MVEMKQKNTRLFKWQIEAMISFVKNNNSNACREMRKAWSVYIVKGDAFNKMTKEQEDLMHFKARAIIEKKIK